ncbi:hypothetical protein ACTU3I_07150 [Microbacterium sp. RD1]|uniref:hypothetical protein n=1 Tax=Microbacterium sp. RD1 TaxID=3457313 RepID=UPI003FA5B300
MTSAHSWPLVDAPLHALALSRRVLDDRSRPAQPEVVLWRDAPALPDAVAAAVREAWRLDIRITAEGRPIGQLPSFAAVLAQARGEQIVRALSHRTNLVLPGARAAVVGDGAIAAALARMLRRGGARVLRAAADPGVRLQARLEGIEVLASDPETWPAVDYVVVTGEGTAALDPATVSGVAIDASFDGSGLGAADGEPARQFVTQTGARTWVVATPPPIADPRASTDLDRHLADVLVAASALVATDPATADARFAELVLA